LKATAVLPPSLYMFLNVGNIVAESRFRFRTRVSCSGIS
jgi:hypothetical protein